MTKAWISEMDVGVHSGTDLGAMLDPAAKAAYRKRLEDLREDMDEARSFNDIERVARIEEEIAALERELVRAVGLHGRDRRAASTVERTRINATRAIKTTIDRIGQVDPVLAAHLQVSIRTGTYCSYTPDPGVTTQWTL